MAAAPPPPAAPTAPPGGGPSWPARLGRWLLVAGAAVAAYANAFQVPLQFDDLPNIVNAPGVHALALDAEAIRRATDGFPANRWLSRLTFALDYLAHGLDPWGWHVLNLAAHVAASLLVLAVGRAVLAALARAGHDLPAPASAGRAALAGALLFAVHPVHTQAVTYVVQRMTSLGGAFALLAIWCWLQARAPGRRPAGWLAGAALAAFLAFSAKETYAVLPLVLLAVEVTAFPGLAARLRARWPLVAAGGGALLLAGGWLAWRAAPLIESEHARLGLSLGERLLSQGRILVHYLSLLALPWPGRLHVDYAWPPSRSLLDPWTTLPALLAVAGLAGWAVAWRRRAPLAALAVLWFLAGLAMEQTILPIDLVYEHRLYLPSVGLLLLAGAWLERALAGRAAWGALAAALPLALLLGAGTVARNQVWADPARLYDDEAGHAPGAARHLLTLAARQLETGQLEAAEATLRQVLALEPRSVPARVNLGNLAVRRRDLAGAERTYREALALDPGFGPAWYALGNVLLGTGRVREAVAAFERAAAADPRDGLSRTNLAVARSQLGDTAGAYAALDDAIRADPGHGMAWLNRAEFRLFAGRVAEALADARQAAVLMPRDARPLVVVGEALVKSGRPGEAAAVFREALGYDPASPRARAGLAATGSR